MTGLLGLFDHGIDTVILAYFLLLNTFYFLFNLLSLAGILRYRRLVAFVRFGEIFRMPIVKPVSVIVPAYNEAQGIIDSVRSLLSLRYPVFEVIVVNDGSTDATLDRLVEAFDLAPSKFVFRKSLPTQPLRGIYRSALHPKLIVVDKINGKKADALNAGLNISRYPLFCAVDADSVLEKDALLKVVRPFLEDPERTIGAGGIIRLSNGCEVRNGQVVRVGIPRNWIARFQILEYLRAFLGGRMGMAMMRSTLIVSGAFGIFRKDIAMACSGYRTTSITEDMDLVIRMQKLMHERKKPYRIQFVPDPICWTEAPENLRVLARQRSRWHRGLVETLVNHRGMLFNPRYGIAGMFARDVTAFYDRFYRPGNAAVIVSGRVDADMVRRRLEGHFGAWSGAAPDRPAVAPPAGNGGERICFVEAPDVAEATIFAGNVIMNSFDPEFYPFLVLKQILGGTTRSRLFMNLRESRGYAYYAFSETEFFRSCGVYWARALVRPESIAPAVQEILREIGSMAAAPASPSEIEEAKSFLIGNLPLRFETTSGFAEWLARYVALSLDDGQWDRGPERFQRVDGERVWETARKYLARRPLVVIVGRPEWLALYLSAFAAVEVYDASGTLKYTASKGAGS